MAKTALENLFAAHGVDDWGEIFPKQICAKCPHTVCTERCAALAVIGGVGAMLAGVEGDGPGSRTFVSHIKKALNS